MKLKPLLFSIPLVATLAAPAARAFETEVIQSSGPGARRVNIIILGDGYLAEDQALLSQRARAFVDALWSHPAFGEYRNYYNVKLVHSISAVRGADPDPDHPRAVQPIFKSFFTCNRVDQRLLCIGDDARLTEVLATDAPEYDAQYDVALVLVNDATYGGSGGAKATASADPASVRIAVHELGHTFAKLADEYEYGNCEAQYNDSSPNVSSAAVRDRLKWKDWISPATPVPTPADSGFANEIGAFLGARYCTQGAYRPAQSCGMRTLATPFCSVCAEALILSVYHKVDPIDAVSPSNRTLTVRSGRTQTFSYIGPRPRGGALEAVWAVDNQPLASGASFDFSTSAFGVGSHSVSVAVRDSTPRVRNDPEGLLSSRFTWSVTVTR